MNKKVLSAILFSALFAGTGTFTSCIDNDEPAGIEELRGAKAELLRAKVAVEQAEASLKLAQAEVEKAKAAKKLADAEISKALAAINQAKADSINVKNEEQREQLNKVIAENKMHLDSMKVKHQIAMNNLNGALALSQRSYELLMAQIEIAKAVGSADEFVTITELQSKVRRAQHRVERAQDNVAEAQRKYDWWVAYDETHAELNAAQLKSWVAEAEESLEDAQEELAMWEGYLENAETADWIAEVETLNDSLEVLKKDSVERYIAWHKALASDSLVALIKAVEEAGENATVDSVYGYKYFGEDYAQTLFFDENDGTALSDGETKIEDEDAKKAELEEALDLIAKYNEKDELVDGILYDNKKELALFTEETKHFLDTIAAEAAGDSALIKASNAAVKAWADTLAMYKNADDKLGDKEDAVETALAAITDFSKPASFDAYRKALIAYYEAAVANGATLNKVPVQVVGAALVDGVATQTSVTSLVDITTALGDATNGNANVKFLYDLNYDFMNLAAATDTSHVDYIKADGNPGECKYTTKAFSKEAMSAEKLLEALRNASLKAFGNAELYLKDLNYGNEHVSNGYLHVMPDTADVKNLAAFNIATKDELGAFGKYVLATDEGIQEYAKNYKSIMADLETAIAYWDATYKTLKAKYDSQEAAVDAAEAAVEAYMEANVKPLYEAYLEARCTVLRLEYVKSALLDAIAAYLPEEFKNYDGENTYNEDATPAENYVAFIAFLDEAVKDAKEAVIEAEYALADAKMWETLIENGKSGVELAQAELDEAIAKLEARQAKLDEALANLAKGLEIIAAVNGTEDAE